MSSEQATSVRRVAVIGAGPAGLATAKQLKEVGIEEVVVFEQAPEVGGVWRYTAEPTASSTGDGRYAAVDLRSFADCCIADSRPMYEALTTNLPSTVMQFPDWPADYAAQPGRQAGGYHYPHRSQVLAYLQRYADEAGLLPLLRLDTSVTAVRRADDGSSWTVSSRRRDSGEQRDERFDAVAVCNGHYARTRLPQPGVDGLFAKFTGLLLHSCNFRTAESFAGRTVVVVGGGFSGVDIAQLAAATARRVYLSRRGAGSVDERVSVLPELRAVTDSRLVFADGETLPHPDVVVLATGYAYDYPMLADGVVSTADNCVTPLYKQLFHCRQPTLAFPGLPYRVVPFALVHHQAVWLARVWAGVCSLPDEAARLQSQRDDEARLAEQGLPRARLHRLAEMQAAYIDDLCRAASVPPPGCYWPK